MKRIKGIQTLYGETKHQKIVEVYRVASQADPKSPKYVNSETIKNCEFRNSSEKLEKFKKVSFPYLHSIFFYAHRTPYLAWYAQWQQNAKYTDNINQKEVFTTSMKYTTRSLHNYYLLHTSLPSSYKSQIKEYLKAFG